MARIFLHDKKFQKILPSSFHEGDFEKLITLQAPNLYPDYHVIPFKKTVTAPSGNSKPDLAFVAKDYNDWYVVEVEMAYHNFDTHVEPQIRNLATANYDGNDVAQYLCSQCKELSFEEVSRLTRDIPPKILIILNEMEERWAADLYNKYGAITSVFEVYHHAISGQQITPTYRAYGISRNYPVYSLSTKTKCSIHPYLAYLGIDNNLSLQLEPGNEVSIEFNGCITFWKVVEGPHGSVWLKIEGREACINRRKNYSITRLRDDSLFLEMV